MEVLQNVYDDGQNTVYLKVDLPLYGEEDAAVQDIMVKKQNWERKFPTRRVVTMSVVTGVSRRPLKGPPLKGYPAVVGLLIYYEEQH